MIEIDSKTWSKKKKKLTKTGGKDQEPWKPLVFKMPQKKQAP